MTHNDGVDSVVPELRLRVEETDNGDYVKLREGSEEEEEEEELSEEPRDYLRGSFWFWVKLIFLLACFAALAGIFTKWIGPLFIDKGLIPFINCVRTKFSIPVLGLLLFATVALFPTLLLPSSPSMWMAGLTFGYGYGFFLILPAVAIGVSLPYFIGHLFLHKLHQWLEKYPKRAAILRAAGEGNWLHQFQAVTLIRISPFPYIFYNYCAVATGVQYSSYIFGSLVGVVPEIFVSIYTGSLIRTLADASHKRQHIISASEIILNVFGFCVTVSASVVCTVYAKKKLKVMQSEEEPLLH